MIATADTVSNASPNITEEIKFTGHYDRLKYIYIECNEKQGNYHYFCLLRTASLNFGIKRLFLN